MNKSEELYQKLITYCKENNVHLTDDNFQYISKKALTKEEYEICFLPDSISQQIDSLAMEGAVFFKNEEYQKAIETYSKGIELIPKEEFEATLWFLVAIAEVYWELKDYQHTLEYLNKCLFVIGGDLNPFIRLRRGQTLYELGRLDEAKNEFQIGFDIDGKGLFNGEDEKYLKLLMGE